MITLITGSMFGQKSKVLIDMINETHNNNEYYFVLKPSIDTRDGLFIKSRDYDITIPAAPWNGDENSKTNFVELAKVSPRGVIKTVFIDEVHFISLDDIQFIATVCQAYGLQLVVGGLLTDFKLDYFPSTKWLSGVCDSYIFLSGKCNKCKKQNAIYNILYKDGKRVTEGESIQVGDSESYGVLCEKCL